MTKVEVRNGNVDNALKRFKIKVARSGVPSELKNINATKNQEFVEEMN